MPVEVTKGWLLDVPRGVAFAPSTNVGTGVCVTLKLTTREGPVLPPIPIAASDHRPLLLCSSVGKIPV